MIKYEFIEKIKEESMNNGKEFINSIEDDKTEFKPGIDNIQKTVSSMANMNYISYLLIGPKSKGGRKQDFIEGFNTIDTEISDIKDKIDALINPPYVEITSYNINWKKKKYRQIKIKIWPSKDACGLPSGRNEEGDLKIKFYLRKGRDTYEITRAMVNRISNEKNVFRIAAQFYERLEFRIEMNKEFMKALYQHLHQFDLFDYPEIDSKILMSIATVAKMLNVDFNNIKQSLYLYRERLCAIKYYHKKRLDIQRDRNIELIYDDDVKIFERIRNEILSHSFIRQNSPNELLNKLKFLIPYKFNY